MRTIAERTMLFAKIATEGVGVSIAERVSIELTADDLLAINNALNEVCHGPDAIAEWEFQTRMGVDRAAAKRTLGRIALALGQSC